MKLRWALSLAVLISTTLLISPARAHHSLQCTTGLIDLMGRGEATYLGRRVGLGSVNSSAFMKSGSAEIENPAPSSSEAFPGKRNQNAAVPKLTSATRNPASTPDPRPPSPERPKPERNLPERLRLPEPPERTLGDEKLPKLL